MPKTIVRCGGSIIHRGERAFAPFAPSLPGGGCGGTLPEAESQQLFWRENRYQFFFNIFLLLFCRVMLRRGQIGREYGEIA